jgi:exopolyphosphatase / guanosine-5'-triphosphate,3'-diphosphate pyrophosphatase
MVSSTHSARTLDVDPPAPLLAGIDLGSNSFRLELARVVHGRYERVAYFKETVRLGGGLDAQGRLSTAALQRGLGCLRRFAKEIRELPLAHVRAVATQTLREASNREAFLIPAERVLGTPIEVISGREEARLTFTGVSRLQPGHKRRLVIDIGGRSTEMILGRGTKPGIAESFAVGSVGLSMAHFADGKLTAKAFRAAQIAAGAELEEALDVFTPTRWQEALGSSGTVSAVSQWLEAAGHGRVVTPALLRWCIEQCLQAGHIDKLNLSGMREDRRPVVAGGLALLYTLCVQFGIKHLLPSRGALRQGVILELHERLQAQARSASKRPPSPLSWTAPGTELRAQTVQALQKRCAVDLTQARRVCETALALHAQLGAATAPKRSTKATSQSTAPDRQTLAWACDLHEIGQSVSHHDFHRHGAYLLLHADAPGFSENELTQLSHLVLGQRGSLGKVRNLWQHPAGAQALIALRLSTLIGHARKAAPSTRLLQGHQHALHLTQQGRRMSLDVSPEWVRANPRTMHLLTLESLAWREQTTWRLDVRMTPPRDLR